MTSDTDKPRRGRPPKSEHGCVMRGASVPREISDAVDEARGDRGWSDVVTEALRSWLKRRAARR